MRKKSRGRQDQEGPSPGNPRVESKSNGKSHCERHGKLASPKAQQGISPKRWKRRQVQAQVHERHHESENGTRTCRTNPKLQGQRIKAQDAPSSMPTSSTLATETTCRVQPGSRNPNPALHNALLETHLEWDHQEELRRVGTNGREK
jgi:hypothetical protein